MERSGELKDFRQINVTEDRFAEPTSAKCRALKDCGT